MLTRFEKLCYNLPCKLVWRNTQVRLKGPVLKTGRSATARGFESLFLRHLISRNRAVWQLVGLITRRSLVQIQFPQPWFVSLEAYDVCLSRRRPRVRIPYEPPFILASQLSWIERLATNQKVRGSNPFERTSSGNGSTWQSTWFGTKGLQVQILFSRPFENYYSKEQFFCVII